MLSERRRHQLYEEAKQVLSVESADELMAYLPPVGWADVATKSDVAMIRVEMDAIRVDMDAFRVGMDAMATKSDFAMIRVEMDAMRTELRGEFRLGIADLKSDLQRWTITTLIAMTGLFGAIVFSVVKFAS